MPEKEGHFGDRTFDSELNQPFDYPGNGITRKLTNEERSGPSFGKEFADTRPGEETAAGASDG